MKVWSLFTPGAERAKCHWTDCVHVPPLGGGHTLWKYPECRFPMSASWAVPCLSAIPSTGQICEICGSEPARSYLRGSSGSPALWMLHPFALKGHAHWPHPEVTLGVRSSCWLCRRVKAHVVWGCPYTTWFWAQLRALGQSPQHPSSSLCLGLSLWAESGSPGWGAVPDLRSRGRHAR